MWLASDFNDLTLPPWWLRRRVGVVGQRPLGSMNCSLEKQGAACSLLLPLQAQREG